MADQVIRGPVGKRHNTQNVTNSAEDQRIVIGLLSSISTEQGGKREAWPAPPLAGPPGQCPSFVVDAIWDFQRFWKTKGVFHNIDGVVDPGGRTLKRLNEIVRGAPPAPPPGPDPSPPRQPIISEPRIPGTWQITNVWSLALGEVGQLGGVELEITEPSGKKFVIRAAGAGFGVSIDPISYAKALKVGLKALNPFMGAAAAGLVPIMEMLGKGVVFNIGDYLQKFGVSLSSVTQGRLIANPINQYIGRPTVLSRSLITGAGIAPFAITSASAGVLAGGEGGVVCMGGVLAPVIGCYGSLGVTIKVGGGVQGMLYSPIKIYEPT